jgi:tripartite-type tricarboxylate transporter receptor subunit TctC
MKLLRRKFLHSAAGAAALPIISRFAWAQTYPTRPIRLVVPFPPGGSYDFIARPLAQGLKPVLGTVFIDNVGGGGGTLGCAAVAHARPDGYTILLEGTNQYVTQALLKRQPQFDPIKDLEPIANVVVGTLAIVVHPTMPAHTLMEFVDYAKASPGKVSYASAGVGTLPHLTGEMLKLQVGIPDLIHVPYRGAGPALTDLMGGQIPMAMVAMGGQVLEFHRAGKLRVLALVSPTRLAGAPELPTAVEQGFPNLIAVGLIGLIAPNGTPKAVVAQVAQATRTALADRDFQQMMIEGGLEPDLDSTPEKFRRSLEGDIAHWTPVVDAIGLKID